MFICRVQLPLDYRLLHTKDCVHQMAEYKDLVLPLLKKKTLKSQLIAKQPSTTTTTKPWNPLKLSHIVHIS